MKPLPTLFDYVRDERIVLTLDAGGTSFRFSALRGGEAITDTIVTPSYGDDLERCLANLIAGFAQVRAQCPGVPVAISFAFPGPAAHPHGVIGELANMPAFRGGVALGPMLEDQFRLPVVINNDADLFTYGEAIAGLLPHVNDLLARAGNTRRYRNLFGVTLGTGFGGGIVRDREIFIGDNALAGEVWLLRHKLTPEMNAEEGASIRAVRRVYAERARISIQAAPDPKTIAAIGLGQVAGNRAAAEEAFRRLGEVAGDALGNALTLIDGLAVVGGGLSGAAPLFFPTLVSELNSHYLSPSGERFRRLTPHVFNLEDPGALGEFLASDTCDLPVPGSDRTVPYDPVKRLGVGLSRLGTSRAIAIGAYAIALRRLEADLRPSNVA